MHLALIPPFSQLSYVNGKPLQMMLPVGFKNEAYMRAYIDNKGASHVILDNGMFEGAGLTNEDLVQAALEYNVDEVVIPDVEGDMVASDEMTQEFLTHALDRCHDQIPFSTMRVVQGSTWIGIREAINSLEGSNCDVLGFPRHMTRISTGMRIDAMEHVVRRYGKRYQLHMLGMSAEWPKELMHAQRQFGPWLRGMDTSAPWKYAFARAMLPGSYIERSQDYFNEHSDAFPKDLVEQNIAILESWSLGMHEMRVNIK
jgi:hypothetical protein